MLVSVELSRACKTLWQGLISLWHLLDLWQNPGELKKKWARHILCCGTIPSSFWHLFNLWYNLCRLEKNQTRHNLLWHLLDLWQNLSHQGPISVVALAGPADLCSRDLTWERATRGRARTIRNTGLGLLGPEYTSDESDYSRPGLVGHSQTHFGRWTLIRSFTAFHTRRQNIIYRPAASVQWF